MIRALFKLVVAAYAVLFVVHVLVAVIGGNHSTPTATDTGASRLADKERQWTM